MVNRDKSDESAAEEKARDVAAKLDETTEPLGGTSNMESHARVGYTEHNVEERAQQTAEEEGVTLHRNPDGSHTAIDESNAAEVTPGSGSKESGVASSTPADSAPSAVAPGAGAAIGSTSGADEGDHEKSRPAVAPGAGAAVGHTSGSDNGANEDSRPAVAPGMGAAVGTTNETDDVDSAPGMGTAVASTAGGGAASTAAAASATGSTSASNDTAAGNAAPSDDTEGGQAPGNDRQKPAGEAATDELGQADVVKILRGSDSVMLATALADGKILAHPMAPQQVAEDADVWFFLALDGDQAKALRTNPEVNISVAEAGNWLSVAGRVEFVDDQAKIDELWSDSAKAWFDDRKDPNLGLVKVVTDSAQHWGLPGGKATGLFRMVKSKITGGRPGGGTQTTEL
ncbi:pyridoxamine 5'-phosphate oxidase family protein [Brevibacterium renqingii]|uniref:pyridoxamine 5'-phosphate oxidase family protein n=1 Tax=Brevibacterium renqingii TaxID=2776916 RepID=UPI0024843970|nr:pyridoxamine 5'-phosphate oxidase family protein [Brevibacterium renqingii]